MSNKQLTPKQKRYVEERAKGKTKKEAAMIAYDTKNPKEMALKAEKSPVVREALYKLFGEDGINYEELMQVARETLHAKAQYTDKETGELRESDLPDHRVRKSMMDSILKFGAPQRKEVESQHVHIQFKGNDKDEEIVKEMMYSIVGGHKGELDESSLG